MMRLIIIKPPQAVINGYIYTVALDQILPQGHYGHGNDLKLQHFGLVDLLICTTFSRDLFATKIENFSK